MASRRWRGVLLLRVDAGDDLVESLPSVVDKSSVGDMCHFARRIAEIGKGDFEIVGHRPS
jgi:hypothetical protein